MKLWMSGEICAEIGDTFREARNPVETIFSEALANKNYDINLDSWDCIAIIRDDEDFKERIRYSPKNKNMDFRLRIDFEEFRSADNLGRQSLIYEMLERSLSLLKGKKGIGKISEIDRLASDARQVAKEHGWLKS